MNRTGFLVPCPRGVALAGLLPLVFSFCAWAEAPIVQPGAPGEPSRVISVEEATRLAGIRHSAADVKFMQDMIPHHQQALDMTVLVAARTASAEMMELARRIEASQADEIAFMERWLSDRGEALPERDWRAHAHHTMEGMATVEQMEELEAARGADFDILFLELMIPHHEGALTMVEELLEIEGAAQDPAFHEFTTEITNGQKAEIERMNEMLASYSPDPRAGLAAGFRDAGEAAWNLELIAALPKPAGFFDPENPAALPLARLRALEDRDDGEVELKDDRADDPDEERPALLDFANTDMAFAGDLLVVGNYHGFQLHDLSGDLPELISAVVCPGGQGDVSVVGDLVIVSVEQNRARVDCGLKGVAEPVSAERFRGLRIFDISDPALPRQVGQVQTCRGSHTHTVVTADDERIIVYNSGIAPVRDAEELAGCIDESPWRDEATALFRIDVIEIPVARPELARIVHSPAVFADPETGILAGLWERGDHGPGTQTTHETDHCHDITVFPEKNLAAGACSGNGILFDITDPARPEEIAFFDRGPIDADELVTGGYWSAYWYAGRIYGTEIVRGLDVFELLPSEFLSDNELAAARLAEEGEAFNPQRQFQVRWPAEPVVARAYIDQLLRAGRLPAALAGRLGPLLDRAEARLSDGESDTTLGGELDSFASALAAEAASPEGIEERRLAGLAETLEAIAARLR